jgi:hypothetical protein
VLVNKKDNPFITLKKHNVSYVASLCWWSNNINTEVSRWAAGFTPIAAMQALYEQLKSATELPPGFQQGALACINTWLHYNAGRPKPYQPPAAAEPTAPQPAEPTPAAPVDPVGTIKWGVIWPLQGLLLRLLVRVVPSVPRRPVHLQAVVPRVPRLAPRLPPPASCLMPWRLSRTVL